MGLPHVTKQVIKPMWTVVKQWRSLPQWIATQLESPNESDFTNYKAWRHRFMHKRLSLTIGLGCLYFLGVTLLHVIPFLLQLKPYTHRIVVNLMTALSMLVWLGWLQTPIGWRQQKYAFLGLSWAVTIFTNIPRTIEGNTIPDLKGWTMMFFAQATMVPFHWKWHVASQLGAYLYYFGVNSALGHEVLPEEGLRSQFIFDLVWICLLPNLVVFLYEKLSRGEFETRRSLRLERQRSQKLLLNILPQPIAERLMQHPETIADSFADATVLFADIVGFTQLSTQLSPTELVELLNQVFSRFDQLAEINGLEKIKTIGDSYMVVAGVPQPRSDHAGAIATMALAMQESVDEFNQHTGHQLKMRVGIHSGPVVAGVIGLHKFAYDLWGDTVNTASRMESHGLPNTIQVSQQTYERLKHQYHFQERGWIDVKGKGEMLTYWLMRETSI